jgi:hypothetical protein
VAVGVDADRDQRMHVDDATALADLLRQRVDPDERVRAGVQGPVKEGGDLLVQVLGHRTDLGLRQLRHPQGLGELLHLAGGDTEEVGGGDHRDQGLFGPAASLEEPVREVAALPQLGNGELDGPGAGVPLARATAVAVVDSLVADLPVFGVAEGVGLGGHEGVGERFDHRAQQIGTLPRKRGHPQARFSSARACRGRLSGAVIVLISFEFRHLEDQPVAVLISGPSLRRQAKRPDQVGTRTPLPRTQPLPSGAWDRWCWASNSSGGR